MNQIDWPWLLMTLLWTGGLAASLSILGLASDRAARAGQPMRAILTRPAYRLALASGSVTLLGGILLSPAPLPFKIVCAIAIAWLWVELARFGRLG
jgi:hypothetical protein